MNEQDLTPVYKSTIAKGFGARRWQIATYVDLFPPCNNSCPAGENILAWLALAQSGAYEAAWRKYIEENPLPATHGRACYHPCESACNRGLVDQTITIHSLDRFLGDLAIEQGWVISAGKVTGKRVLVVGAGPAGLSCAYHLRRLGHDVEIRDANPKPGGLMHYGIPQYRLPRDGLLAEIARIEAMGVTFVPNCRVEDVLAERDAGRLDAGFLGIGAQVANHHGISSKDLTPAMANAVFDELLKQDPKHGFSVGIRDDVSGSSLDYEPAFDIEAAEVIRALFFGLGSDGTVGANKNSTKILAEDPAR